MKSMTGINTNRQLNVEMDNTHDLLMKRKNKDCVVIVTTIQKLPKIMKTYDREDKKRFSYRKASSWYVHRSQQVREQGLCNYKGKVH